MIWTARAPSNGCQDPGGQLFPPSPLVVAAAPPPLHDVAHRSAAAPSCQPGTIPRVLPRLAATSSDESLRGNVVTGHQLPARRVRHDVVGNVRRPGSSGRVSALQRRIRRGGLARARGPRGVGRHQPWEHDTSSPSSFDDPHLDTPLMRGMHALPPRRAMTESTSTQLLPALARAQLTCVRRGATCGRAAGVRTPGTRACVCLRPRHALASVLSPASQGAHAPDTDAIVSDRSPGPGNSMACRRRLRTTCVRRFACEGPMLRNLHGIGNTCRPLL